MTPLIRIEKLSAGYSQNHDILSGINLSINPGDFLGIIGPNGGGKTTLLRVILGLLTPREGRIEFNFPGHRHPQAQMGYMPQQRDIDSAFPITVRDLVLSGYCEQDRIGRRITRDEKKAADILMEQMGIASLGNRPIGDLSGGQQQRAFLARALVNQPTVLLLDEPDTFVDSGFVQSFYELLDQIGNNLAILLVSHDLGTIAAHVKSIACVNGGLHYHDSGEITQEILDSYHCPIQLISHGPIPHRVLLDHPTKP
jgi:zinc transport system ATP-binding protein